MDYIRMGKRIRSARKWLGMTQEGLAARVGLSLSFVGHIERGTRKASIETIVKICEVLKLSLDELLAETPRFTLDGKGRSFYLDEAHLLREIHRLTERWVNAHTE